VTTLDNVPVAKARPSDAEIAREVMRLIDGGLHFNDAFADVAHEQLGLFHGDNPVSYNALFRIVMDRIKKKIGKTALLDVCKRPRRPARR
jgi:hypothetical protein